jgi:hypothetical protein
MLPPRVSCSCVWGAHQKIVNKVKGEVVNTIVDYIGRFSLEITVVTRVTCEVGMDGHPRRHGQR